MSTLDISRFLKQPKKRYSGSRHQQGRLLTDADFNEAAWQRAYDRQRVLLDAMGAYATPDVGFSLGQPFPPETDPSAEPPVDPPVQTELLRVGDPAAPTVHTIGGEDVYVRPFTIRAGNYYVGGRHFVMDRAESFPFQRDFLQMKGSDIPLSDRGYNEQIKAFRTLYYLNAWEQVVTSVEDRELGETALEGDNPSTRVRRMRRVQAMGEPYLRVFDCRDAFGLLIAKLEDDNATFDHATGELRSNGRLRLTYNAVADDDNCRECNPDPAGRFLGADNQMVRMMLTAADRFVWSFDNAAPLVPVKVSGLSTPGADIRVTVLAPFSDEQQYPLENRVVEIIPFAALLDGSCPKNIPDPHFNKVADEIGAFSRVAEPFNPSTQSFTLDSDAPGIDEMRAFVSSWSAAHPGIRHLYRYPEEGEVEPPDERYFYMRLWHVAPKREEITLATGNEVRLGGTGLIANFTQAGRRGDFWSVTFRPESPEPIVPYALSSDEAGQPPDGPKHYFAPLAFVRGDNDVVQGTEDCRPVIRSLTDRGCVTLTVGGCSGGPADHSSIQEAVNALPEEGGTILVLPGTYKESVVIDSRHDIVIQGCGPQTIVQAVDNDSVVFHVRNDSESIRIQNLTVHAATNGIIAENCTDVTLQEVVAKAGFYVDGEYSFGAFTSANAVFSLAGGQRFHVTGCHFEHSQRFAIQLSDVEGAQLSDLEIVGASVLDRAQSAIILNQSRDVLISRSRLETFGMIGVLVRNDNHRIRLEDLDIQANSNTESTVGSLARSPKAGVDVYEGSDIVMRGCRVVQSSQAIGFDACISVRGDDIRVEGCHVEARDVSSTIGPSAWGGIHIRGGSNRVTVVDSRVSGGVGYGITLGSVLFGTGFSEIRRGVGAQRMVGSGGVPYQVSERITPVTIGSINRDPIDEGPLSDIIIEGNRIEGMNNSGISSFLTFGLPHPDGSAADFIEVSRLRIVNNRIENNVRFARVGVAAQTNLPIWDDRFRRVTEDGTNTGFYRRVHVPEQAFGGVVLGTVSERLEVSGNTIIKNGGLRETPVCGIYVLNGEGISICNNRIAENGLVATSARLSGGERAGIAVMLAGLGAAPRESSMVSTLRQGGDQLAVDDYSVRVMNNNVRQPEGRALHIVATGPVAVQNNFLSTQGFHGELTSVNDEQAVGDAVYIQNLGAPFETHEIEDLNLTTTLPPPTGASVFFQDYSTRHKVGNYLTNVVPHSPRNFVGLGGQVLFSHNQVVLDWTVKQVPAHLHGPVSISASMFLSLDHVSVTQNHFGMRLQGNFQGRVPDPEADVDEPLLSHAFAAGGSVLFNSNRLGSNVKMVRHSVTALGELQAYGYFNQTTHETLVKTAGFGSTTGENQTMFTHIGGQGNFSFLNDEQLNLFFGLLNRPPS